MPEPIDIAQALAGVTFLDGRTRESDTAGTFARLADYRDGAIFVGGFSGASPWERHPADEIVQILDGAATVSLMMPGGVETRELAKGTIIIVPEGVWHRLDAPDRVTLMTVSPQPTDHVPDAMPPADLPAG